MKKYAVFESYVYSADGDKHMISCSQIMSLYKVNPQECIRIPYSDSGRIKLRGYDTSKLIFLYPDQTGAYELPTQTGEDWRFADTCNLGLDASNTEGILIPNSAR